MGSPDPPLPYTTEPYLSKVKLDRPIYAKSEPGTDWLVVVQQGGEAGQPAKLLRLADSADTPSASTMLEVPGQLIYGIEFHPNYAVNGQLFTFSNGPVGQPERKNRISRYIVDRDTQVCDPASEQRIIEWRSMGHDGGELAFGADGMLYISSGDGTSDSDTWYSAQDVTNLLGGILRIDVDDPEPGRAYSIPPDNPFLDIPNARGELWAFGLRNPWRLWADRQSGQIWVGVNGQDLWETVHLVRRGENYGWSVYEGSHPFYPKRQRGPAPIVAPTVEHHHTVARSLTGGVVYRGGELPELEGAYIYGDYSTGKIWGVRHDGLRVTWNEELADTTLQIAGFALSPTENLLVVDHGGGLHRLVKARHRKKKQPFPQRLSETGLFRSTFDHVVEAGIFAYRVHAPGWNDGATSQRYIALPNDKTMQHRANRAWDLPEGSVLVQTLSQPDGRRIETRLLTRQQNEWNGYAYIWNDSQTDAELVPAAGKTLNLHWPGEDSPRPWRVPGRAECMSCHSRAVGFVLGVTQVQLAGDALRDLVDHGLFATPPVEPLENSPRVVNPSDTSHPLELRARSYLHANCSSCHVNAGGGNSRMELEISTSLDKTGLLGARPQHATFGIENAQLIAPGEPERSVVIQRLSRRGSGQMPPLVSTKVDARGVALLREWIASMQKKERPLVREWKVDDLSESLLLVVAGRSLEDGQKVFKELRCHECHRFAGQGGGAGPKLSDIAKTRSLTEILQSIVDPSAQITKGFENTVVVLKDGTSLQGRVEAETPDSLTLQTGESFGPPTVIRKSDVETQLPSRTSLMPSGLLNTLRREEILDLLAYLTFGAEKPVRLDSE